MAFVAPLQTSGREAERHALEADATLRAERAVPVDAIVVNVSARGCLFFCEALLDLGTPVTIGMAGIGRRAARIVRAEGERYACAFDTPLNDADLSVVLSAPGDTVARFPAAVRTIVPEEAPPIAAKWPRGARLALVPALGALSWAAIFLVRSLIA